jgi:hypothetical protein
MGRMKTVNLPLLIAQSMLHRRTALKYVVVCLGSLLCAIFFVAVAVRWNGRYVEVFNVTLDQYDVAGQRILSMKQLFDELFCDGWLILGVPTLYALLLTPLSNSFSVNGSLWLRLLVSQPIWFSLGRLMLALGVLSLTAVCGLLWALCVHWIHDIPLPGLLRAPAGFVGHCAFSSGALVLAMTLFDARRMSSSTRHGLQVAVLFLPVMTFLLWSKMRPSSGNDIPSIRWIPYAVPYISVDPVTLPHSLSCLIAGFAGYIISCLLALPRPFKRDYENI